MSSQGFAFEGGVEFKVFRIRIAPEIRYTRWGGDSGYTYFTKSNQNQVELLAGITF
jgi:hypothetical protein